MKSSLTKDEPVTSLVDNATANVKIRRHDASVACEVVVLVRGQEMVLHCRDYSQAIKWARIECKTYGIDSVFVERVGRAVAGQA